MSIRDAAVDEVLMPDGRTLRIMGPERLRDIDLKDFPLEEDFAIELIDDVPGSSMRFLAPKLGAVVRFPWWDGVLGEIGAWSLSDIPNGSAGSPYWDMDQGWHILIWQSDNVVYVAQGGSEEYVYDVWFSVPASRYSSEWEKAIRLAASAEADG